MAASFCYAQAQGGETMRYVVEIEQIITASLVVSAHSKHEARQLAQRLLQKPNDTVAEEVGDTIAKSPRIRSVRKLGE